MAENQSESAAAEGTIEASEFESLLSQEFKPKSERSKQAVESAVQTLAEQLINEGAVISSDVLGTIQAIIAEIDEKLTEQVNKIYFIITVKAC